MLRIKYVGEQAQRLHNEERLILQKMFRSKKTEISIGTRHMEISVKNNNSYIVKIVVGRKNYPRYVRVEVTEALETFRISHKELNDWEYVKILLETVFEGDDELFNETLQDKVNTLDHMFIRFQEEEKSDGNS